MSTPLPGIVPDGSGTRITIQVVPRASKSEIVGAYGDEAVRVRLNAPPVDGKANAELISLFSKLLSIPARSITLASGQTGRRKAILIAGLSPDTIQRLLQP